MSTPSTDDVVIDVDNQRLPLTATPEDLLQMLLVIKDEILPKTVAEVSNGNKVFGAAILSKDFQCVFCDTNTETECPIFHGEVKTIVKWSEQTPAQERGPQAQSSIFLSTHEPCCMCISSILWAGFTKVYYFFGYSITKDQGIPHDIQTMHELWGVSTYRKQNKYLSTASIMEMIEAVEESNELKPRLVELQKELLETYDKLSTKYHTEKSSNADNSLVLG
jgi:tRNA(Arg) A34 adenosine deaminase TadA